MVETINKVIRVSRQLLQEHGHDPSAEEIAAEMNMPLDKVRDILKIAQEPVSLETPIGEEEDSHLGDFIPDEDASEPSEAASFWLLKEQLMEARHAHPEKKVLELRFGIVGSRRSARSSSRRAHPIEAKALPATPAEAARFPELSRIGQRPRIFAVRPDLPAGKRSGLPKNLSAADGALMLSRARFAVQTVLRPETPEK